MAVVKKLGLVQCDKSDRPISEVRILRAYLVPALES
jgi:hypothetical protein